MAVAISTYLNDVRLLLGDDGVYVLAQNYARPAADGMRKRFEVPMHPLGDDAAVYHNGTVVSTGYTLDADTGLLVYTSAPAAGTVITVEGTVYDYSDSKLVSCMSEADRMLRNIWENTFTITGTSSSATIDAEPTVTQRRILALAARYIALGGKRVDLASHWLRTSGPGGVRDTTGRAREVREAVQTAFADLWNELMQGGFVVVGREREPEFGVVFDPSLGIGTASGA